MNRELVLPAGAPRDEWLALRRTGIGGSDVAAIVGLDTYRSPFGVWYDKRYGDPDDNAGEAAEVGNYLEDVVARMAATRHNVRIRNTGMWRSTERPHQLANPDRLIVGERGLFEVKTRAGARADEWQDGAVVPESVQLQCQHYLDVMDAEYAIVVALLAPTRGGMRLRTKQLRRDDELIAEMRVIEGEFWERVQSGDAPPVDGDKRTGRLIARMYDAPPDSIVDLTDEADQVHSIRTAYDFAAAQEKHYEALKRKAQHQGLLLLGDRQIGRVNGQVVLKRIDVKPTDVPATTRAGYTRMHFPKAKEAKA